MFTIRIELMDGTVHVAHCGDRATGSWFILALTHSHGWRLMQLWSGMTCLEEVTK